MRNLKNAAVSQIFGERDMDLSGEEQVLNFKISHFLNPISVARPDRCFLPMLSFHSHSAL